MARSKQNALALLILWGGLTAPLSAEPPTLTDDAVLIEGSPGAAELLRAANESTLDELKSVAGLAVKAAENIHAYRVGEDGIPGTDDDEFYSSVGELDQIPFVTRAELLALHRFSIQKFSPLHLADPYDPASCTGESLTPEKVAKYIPLPHGNEVPVGNFRMVARRRFCYADGPCKDWEDTLNEMKLVTTYFRWSSRGQDHQISDVSRPSEDKGGHFGSSTGDVFLELRNDKPRLVLIGAGSEKDLRTALFDRLDGEHSVNRLLFAFQSKPVSQVRDEGPLGNVGVSSEGLSYLQFGKAKVTQKCLRYSASWKHHFVDDKANKVFREYELVLLGEIHLPEPKTP
jgi:hypothetical protein